MPSAYFYLCVLCIRNSMTRIEIKEALEYWARKKKKKEKKYIGEKSLKRLN